MKNILVCGVPNSENLGDRVIAETVNYLIKTSNEKQEILNYDLTSGGIIKSQKLGSANLNPINKLKQFLPDFMRSFKVYIKYKKNINLALELKKKILASRLIVIGGGHLLIDNYLNFPIGIHNIIKEARKNNIPVVFAFVGAKGPWSKIAKKFYLQALDYADYVSVRDYESKKFLVSMDNKLEEKIQVLSDPALFVADAYGESIKRPIIKKVGLGIMDSSIVKKHSNSSWDREQSAKWWATLAKELSDLGFEVNIFTNGAPTDNGFIENYLKNELPNCRSINFCDYPINHEELINTIKDQDLIVAQRLHACLPSLSLTNPTFGVIWDKKLENIFTDLNLHNFIIDFNQNAQIIASKVEAQAKKNNTIDKEVITTIDFKKKEMFEFVAKAIK